VTYDNPASAGEAAALAGTRQRSPYQGLSPYAEEDAPFFFGRDGLRKIIIANLEAYRLTVVYGTSGVGKTSVLRAGVAHGLKARARANLANDGGQGLTVVVVFDAWRDDPIVGILTAIRRALAELFGPGIKLEPATGGLVETLRRWTDDLSCELLILLDQTEEYFLYHAGEDGDHTFAMEFPRVVNTAELPVHMLVSIREDMLSRLDRFKSRIPGMIDNRLVIQHLNLHAARAAIKDPLEEYNRRSPDGRPWLIEPELVQLLLEELPPGRVVLGGAGEGRVDTPAGQDQPDQYVETPFLQLVMTRLWNAEVAAGSRVLRADTLRKLGGARRIVRGHLGTAMQALRTEERDLAAHIFHYLVTPAGTKIAYAAADLAGSDGPSETEISRLLERLSHDARLVRPVGPPPDGSTGTRYEVFHDVLAPAILDWRARHAAAQAAEERLRETRARLRRLSALAVVLGLLLIISVVSVVLAVSQSRRAEAAARLATSRQLTAEAATTIADDPRTALRLGIAAQQLHDDADTRAGLVHGLTTTAYAGTFAGHRLGVNSVALTPDGRTLATASADGTVILWDVARRTPLGQPLQDHRGAVWSVAFSPDGRTLASAGDDGTVILWSVTRRVPLGPPLRGHHGLVTAVAFSPDGRTLASGSKDKTVRLWDVARRAPLGRPLVGHRDTVWSLAFSPDGRTLASGSRDWKVRLWDVTRRSPLGPALTGHQGPVNSVAFSPDGRTLASGSSDKTVILRNLTDPAHPAAIGRPLTGHRAAVWSVAFSHRGGILATAGYDTSSILWDIGDPARPVPVRRLNGHHSAVTAVAFSPDDRTLVTGSQDATAIRWDLKGVRLAPPGRSLKVNEDGVASVAFSPDGQTLATAGADGKVALWKTGRWARLGGPLEAHQGEVTAVAFSPDGDTLASAGADKTVRLWAVADPTAPVSLGRLTGHTRAVNALAFNRDGHTLASAGDDNTIRLWDVTSRTPLGQPLTGHQEPVNALAFSPYGGALVSGGEEGTVIVWNVADPTHPARLGRPLGYPGAVAAAAFSPDGDILAIGGGDRSVALWDVTDAAHPARLGRPLMDATDEVNSIAFSPEGRTLVAGVEDGSAVLWTLTGLYALRDTAVDRACSLAGGDLDRDEWSRYVSDLPYQPTCPRRP
jgi:WD40 repeat protein